MRLAIALICLLSSACFAGQGMWPVPYAYQVAGGGDCTTQSVLLNQVGGTQYNREVSGIAVAAKFSGNGKKLYSIKAKTGGIPGGTPGAWIAYINTALDFDSDVTDSFPINPPSTADTEFSALSAARPLLVNGVEYYIAFHKPGSGWGDRVVFALLSGAETTPVNNLWDGPLGGSFTQSTVSSLWVEVKTCD